MEKKFYSLKKELKSEFHYLMEKYEIKKDYDLFFWMLYHEFGHLKQMEETFQEKGLEELQKELKNYEKMVEVIKEEVKNNLLTEKEGEEMYRKLENEKKADYYADTIYRLRKKEIKKRVKKINRGG